MSKQLPKFKREEEPAKKPMRAFDDDDEEPEGQWGSHSNELFQSPPRTSNAYGGLS
jgi:hypothetical protein